eukprot:scaffold4061_cov344-Prasinococcus_capsulatus_cf.AAC.4
MFQADLAQLRINIKDQKLAVLPLLQLSEGLHTFLVGLYAGYRRAPHSLGGAAEAAIRHIHSAETARSRRAPSGGVSTVAYPEGGDVGSGAGLAGSGTGGAAASDGGAAAATLVATGAGAGGVVVPFTPASTGGAAASGAISGGPAATAAPLLLGSDVASSPLKVDTRAAISSSVRAPASYALRKSCARCRVTLIANAAVVAIKPTPEPANLSGNTSCEAARPSTAGRGGWAPCTLECCAHRLPGKAAWRRMHNLARDQAAGEAAAGAPTILPD